ncbi:O-antigen ligase family protein [Campylobacter corcagiensis]|uniref:O-antigen ligase family protein n=1 Tax=Campylobacter corcagiensis TaxID=1448857 RepID=A0A7M1LEL6_9BACT|nr:O-antigen ligase family protein [Campylobacter corcagiensis]QKF65078.1 putative membrane protein [Campylobacter corcagiensis]QOQ86773.1 O-antigen ligase family protein [Campylobacter corcagiensis]
MGSQSLRYIDCAICVLLFIFIICEHHVEFTAIKNISLYLALFLSLALFSTNKQVVCNNIKNNFLLAKYQLIFLSIFIFYAFVIALFPYSKEFGTFGNTFSEFGRGVSFLFVVLIYASSSETKPKIFFYSLLAAYVLITLYYMKPLFTEFDKINVNGETSRIINRAYSFFVDRFFIFGLMGIFLFKNKYLKSFFIIFSLIAVIMSILTGARGAWLCLVVCVILFLIAIFFTRYKNTIKKRYKPILFITILSVIVVGYFASRSGIFQYKISQNNSSGRDMILKERFPLLLKSDRAFWGLGYEEHQYDEFLSNKLDEGHNISMMIIRNGKRHWWNDEPFFIGNYYYFGFIGTLALFLSFFALLISCFAEFKKSRNLLYAGIFISVFSYFGVRGIVETYNLKILYLFYMIGFFILVKRGLLPKNKI